MKFGDVVMDDGGTAIVIGADSLIGGSLIAHLRERGTRVLGTSRRLTTNSRSFLDIVTMARAWLPPPKASVAYFCAGITKLYDCRKDPVRARDINVSATIELVCRLVDAGVFVVFPSTNLVFDGTRPFESSDAKPCPRTVYGVLKADAEARLLQLGTQVGVVRMTKVIGTQYPLFDRWRSELQSGRTIHPFRDMVFSPLPLRDAVAIMLAVGESRITGIVQVSGAADISYSDACRFLFRSVNGAESLLEEISYRDGGQTFEHVPLHTTLDVSRARAICGFVPPDPYATLAALMPASPQIRLWS